MFKVSAALPRLGLDACTMVADGRSLSSLPGDDEQLQLLEGSILAAVRLVVILGREVSLSLRRCAHLLRGCWQPERRGDREFRCRFLSDLCQHRLRPRGWKHRAQATSHQSQPSSPRGAQCKADEHVFVQGPELAEETVHEEGPSAIQGLHVSATHPGKENDFCSLLRSASSSAPTRGQRRKQSSKRLDRRATRPSKVFLPSKLNAVSS